MLYLQLLDFRNSANELKSAYELERGERIKRQERIKKENNKIPIVLLITCTRIEVYSEGRPVSFESIERAFSFNHIASFDKRSSLEADDVLFHLFRLSLGLDSPLFGEELILKQLKEAREMAIEMHSASSYLLRLFQSAISFSKTMHTRYKIRIFDESIAIELSKMIKKDKRVLIVGSGELARMVAKELIKNGSEVSISLRDEKKTFLLEKGSRGISYEKRREEARKSDVVISASSGIYYTFEDSDKELLSGKLLFDLASPYDIPNSLSPIRLEDLNIEMPKRKEMLEKLSLEIDKAVKDFKLDIEMKEESILSEDFSISVLRRLKNVIGDLPISDDEKKSLEEAIFDSTRKAYIEKERKIRKR